ncbi:MAG: TVP38/TMEM64 family protein [Eggerthellaceae bacterium]
MATLPITRRSRRTGVPAEEARCRDRRAAGPDGGARRVLRPHGPELLAFVADAPRFRAWVDETGWISRIVFVLANMAQVVFAFLARRTAELGAGYAFGFWEGTLWCLVASALRPRRSWRSSAHSESASSACSSRPRGSRRCDGCATPDVSMLLFLCFLIPGTPKDLLTYVAGLGSSSIGRIVAITTVGRIPSIVVHALAAARSATAITWGRRS